MDLVGLREPIARLQAAKYGEGQDMAGRESSWEGDPPRGTTMPLALASASYPLLDIFWTILEVVVWVIWIWVLIWVFIDIFRSHDLSGLAKALWFLFVLVIPLFGVLAYLILRGGSMHQRALERAQQQEDAFRQYIRSEASGSPPSAADQLEKLGDLRDRGVITPDEFQRQKEKVLAA